MTSLRCPACFSSSLKTHVPNPEDREYFVQRKAAACFERCLDCQAIFQTPFPTLEEANSFYNSDYQNYTTSKAPLIGYLFKISQERNAQHFIRQYGRAVSVLDFGCNQGLFLKSLKSAGVEKLSGFDVVAPSDPSALQHFKFYSSLDELKVTESRFDVIRMNHVIEHLVEVDSVMSLLASILTPNGKIIGQTPNAAHYTSSLMGTYWGPLHYPYHCLLFSEESLKKSSPRWGLCLESTSKTIQPTGWSMTLENILKPLTHPKTTGRSRFYAVYLLITLPLVFWDRVIGITGTAIMDFVLSRQIPSPLNDQIRKQSDR